MKIGLRVPPCRPATEIAAFAADVEAAGFDTLYVPDSQLLWRDSYLTLFAAALRTSTLHLGTAVSNVITRHPSVVASLARTVAEAAPGRFFLGLGVGNSSVIPLGLKPSTQAELRRGIDQIRGLLAGDEVDGVRMRDPYPNVPIHVAATGPRNLRFAGEVADGVILLSGVAPDLVDRAIGLATASGPTEITVSAYAMVTDDLERDARMLKPLCAAITQHRDVPEIYPDLVHAEDWDHAVDICSQWVSDDDAVAFAREFCLFGTADEIVERIESTAKRGVTTIFLQHVGSYDLPERLMADFAEILPRLR